MNRLVIWILVGFAVLTGESTQAQTVDHTPRPADLGAAFKQREQGLEILVVAKGSIADQMKLQVGDVILRVNDENVASRDEVTKAVGKSRDLHIKVLRGGKGPEVSLDGYLSWLVPKDDPKRARPLFTTFDPKPK